MGDTGRGWFVFSPLHQQERLISQIKMVTKVMFLYIPLPMFWALFDQQVVWRGISVQMSVFSPGSVRATTDGAVASI